jgi:hypothetical protein
VRKGGEVLGRVVLALMTLYALGLIVPDFLRIARPLGSFGLATNADGLVYDALGPFADEERSPAFRAGVRVGDRLDLKAMRCLPVDTEPCATNLALWGGVNYVMPGRMAVLKLTADGERPAREVRLVAERRPRSVALDIVLALAQTAGVLVVLGAAYLVWIRPGPMTWGFFLYAMYFNPGQSFQALAWLQQWPPALLAQDVISCVLQAAGYTGLILFALRAPVDRADGRWRRVERLLPDLAIVLLAIEIMSLGSLFGFKTEFAMRSALIIGFAVSAAAIAILLARRRDLSPRDFQRIRWVIWGSLIGLPANLAAELWQETSLPHSLFGAGAATEDVAGLFYLVNGVLCLFVVEAVRRPTVVSVGVPLRRATVLGLLLSLPVFFIHEELNTINEWTALPEWAWALVASVLVFLIARAHEWTTELADRLFDRDFRRAERRLEAAGRALINAASLDEIERLIVAEPVAALGLASAAVFREEKGVLRRTISVGWEALHADVLKEGEAPLRDGASSGPFPIPQGSAVSLPDDLARPVLGVPIGNPRRRFAVALYSAHEAGTDLDGAERGLLAALASDAEIAYGQVEREALKEKIARLEALVAGAASRG